MSRLLCINILTIPSLVSTEQGRELLRLWIDLLPEYLPERFGNYEPLRRVFVPDDVDAILEYWDWPFLVTRTRPRMRGGIFMSRKGKPTHGWIKIELAFKPSHQVALLRFFKAVSVQLKAEFGFMDFIQRDDLGVTTHDLKVNLPDFYWATVLGKAYVDLFGREKIVSAPASEVEQLSSDLYYLQMSKNLFDVETDEVAQTRQQIKRHLNSNVFFDPDLGSDHAYSVPEFSY